MIDTDTGIYKKAIKYIARKEEFQNAITNQGYLRVIAVYPDGETNSTRIAGYIKSVDLKDEPDTFHVTIYGTNSPSFELIII